MGSEDLSGLFNGYSERRDSTSRGVHSFETSLHELGDVWSDTEDRSFEKYASVCVYTVCRRVTTSGSGVGGDAGKGVIHKSGGDDRAPRL